MAASDDWATSAELDAALSLPDVESFDGFYAREYRLLVAFAHALTGSRAHAEDVAQEAMLAAYRRWDEVSRLDAPHAWVRRVCANLAVSFVRRRMVEAQRAAPAASPSQRGDGSRRRRRDVLGRGRTTAASARHSASCCATSTAARWRDRAGARLRGRNGQDPPVSRPVEAGDASRRRGRGRDCVMNLDTRARRAADGVRASARGVDPMAQITELRHEDKTRRRTTSTLAVARRDRWWWPGPDGSRRRSWAARPTRSPADPLSTPSASDLRGRLSSPARPWAPGCSSRSWPRPRVLDGLSKDGAFVWLDVDGRTYTMPQIQIDGPARAGVRPGAAAPVFPSRPSGYANWLREHPNARRARRPDGRGRWRAVPAVDHEDD